MRDVLEVSLVSVVTALICLPLCHAMEPASTRHRIEGPAADLTADEAVAGKVRALPPELRDRYRISEFYQKYLVDDCLLVLSSQKVTDVALLEVAYIVNHMLAQNQAARSAFTDSGARLVVMAPTEMTTDIPEHAHLRPAAYWNRRARGLGWSRNAPIVSCGEENVLNFDGDPYDGENILIHELSHAVHRVAMAKLDPNFDSRLERAYDRAMTQGLWKGTYAATNREEYWAEGTQSWFDANAAGGKVHNDVDTREELKRYDEGLSRLLTEVYGDGSWRYVRSDRRKEPAHMREFVRSAHHIFAWPANTAEAREE